MSDFDDDDESFHAPDEADDLPEEALVWQLLQLINPGDEETALQEFAAYRDAEAQAGGAREPVELVGQVIDWRSGFYVETGEPRTLVQAIDELALRWNLAVDWGGDTAEEDFFEEMDSPALLAVAYDRLLEFGYTVWLWETGEDAYAGWMTLARDNEPMRELATALGINLRLASEAG
ncbi:DUF6630 family protein [Frateuria defendens]|uniref:DUF6630 family protein n=1 Tax=Frateuria defendens TaxID=2219559 RepID=UPI00066FDADD|nr:hypothetical protein [Frateuria defendens]